MASMRFIAAVIVGQILFVSSATATDWVAVTCGEEDFNGETHRVCSFEFTAAAGETIRDFHIKAGFSGIPLPDISMDIDLDNTTIKMGDIEIPNWKFAVWKDNEDMVHLSWYGAAADGADAIAPGGTATATIDVLIDGPVFRKSAPSYLWTNNGADSYTAPADVVFGPVVGPLRVPPGPIALAPVTTLGVRANHCLMPPELRASANLPNCINSTEEGCTLVGGTFDPLSECPTGACCQGSGCTEIIENDCVGNAGYLGDDISCGPGSCSSVPAVSEWGLVVLALLVLTTGTLVCAGRRSIPA